MLGNSGSDRKNGEEAVHELAPNEITSPYLRTRDNSKKETAHPQPALRAQRQTHTRAHACTAMNMHAQTHAGMATHAHKSTHFPSCLRIANETVDSK